jgi:hypothetical protein
VAAGWKGTLSRIDWLLRQYFKPDCARSIVLASITGQVSCCLGARYFGLGLVLLVGSGWYFLANRPKADRNSLGKESYFACGKPAFIHETTCVVRKESKIGFAPNNYSRFFRNPF